MIENHFTVVDEAERWMAALCTDGKAEPFVTMYLENASATSYRIELNKPSSFSFPLCSRSQTDLIRKLSLFDLLFSKSRLRDRAIILFAHCKNTD